MTSVLTDRGVQQFSITIASAAYSNTATISSVGSGAFILYNGDTVDATSYYGGDRSSGLSLTNSTTITATRGRNPTGHTVTIKGCIVDGDTTSFIKSVQRGTITIAANGTSNTATISSVTDGNTALHVIGETTATADALSAFGFSVLSLSGTTLTATRCVVAYDTTVYYEVIEFQSGALAQDVQRVELNTTSSGTSFTSTITSVDTNNTICIYGGQSTNAPSWSKIKISGSLTNATTFTYNVYTAGTDTKKYGVSIVSFKPWVLARSVQRGISRQNTSPTSVTVSATTIAYSAISYLYFYLESDTVSSQAQIFCHLAQSATTTITLTFGSTGVYTDQSWELYEFSRFVISGGMTETADTLAATTTEEFITSMGATEGASILDATANTTTVESFTTSMDKTEDADTFASSSVEAFLTSMGVTEGIDTLQSSISENFLSSMGVTETVDALSSTASESFLLSSSVTESPDTLVSSAVEQYLSSIAVTETEDLFSSVLAEQFYSTADFLESGDQFSASSFLNIPVVTSGSFSESSDQLSSTAFFHALVAVSGSFSESPDALVSSATETFYATLSTTEGSDVFASTCQAVIDCVSSLHEGADGFSASVHVVNFNYGTVVVVESPDVSSAITVIVLAEKIISLSLQALMLSEYGYSSALSFYDTDVDISGATISSTIDLVSYLDDLV